MAASSYNVPSRFFIPMKTASRNKAMLDLCLLTPITVSRALVKTRVSYLPYGGCTHFVERPNYSDRLKAFFMAQLDQRQIFVLWGLGGVGYASQSTWLR